MDSRVIALVLTSLLIAAVPIYYYSFFTDKCATDFSCDDGLISTSDKCSGSPKSCRHNEITSCITGDKYCPSNCNHISDSDCACKSSKECEDGKISTKDTCLSGSCKNIEIISCEAGDNYCPQGCNGNSDTDCPPVDLCSSAAECSDNDLSTRDLCEGVPKVCIHKQITACNSGDNYCPSNCKSKEDNDCPLPCTLGSKEPCIKFGLGTNIKVLVLKYLPTDGDELDLSQTGDWQNPKIDSLRAHINELDRQLVTALTEASRYHGYKNNSAAPSLNYQIYEEKEYLRQIRKSSQFAPFADHISELNQIDICDYVENKGVKEVWIWMVHNKDVVPIESNMAGPNGDISNSNRLADLPVCKSTYTVYDYNYGRGLGEAMEDHGHQLETIFKTIDSNLWFLFERPIGQEGVVNSCGWSHSPSNTNADYDWYNTKQQLSDCEEWTPLGGPAKIVDCHTWSDSPDCYSSDPFKDANVGWKIYWMQNMPGYENGLTYKGQKMRNWWEFTADFDKALSKGWSLTE